MYVRLGFAVAVAADPDILLVDEVLAVGDARFARRCLDRLAHLRRRGVTMILVSHDLDLVCDLADRAVYLDGGRAVADGPADTVVARYRSDVAGSREGGARAESTVRVVEEGRRWGRGDVVLEAVEVSTGGVTTRVLPSGCDAALSLRYRVERPVEDAVFGLAWHRAEGVHVGGHNTEMDGVEPLVLTRDGTLRCCYGPLHLAPGEYLVDAAVHTPDGLAYDYWCQAARVRVTAAADWPGVWAPPHRWEGPVTGVRGPG